GFFSGAICNRIGVKWTLIIGTLGYAPYGAALYTNAKFGNNWFPILGGLTCGISAVFLWTSSGAVNLVYPPVHQRGRAVATKFALQNLGGFIGGLIAVGLNATNAARGRVSDATFFGITSIMCLGLPAALTVPRHPQKVIRTDGSRVRPHKFLSWKEEIRGFTEIITRKEFLLLVPYFIYCQWDLSYMWAWNATYHTVRARAVLSTCFYLVGPTIIGPIQGLLLDNPKWPRQNRSRLGVTSFFIVAVLTWIYGLIVQYQYSNRPVSAAIDIFDPIFAKSLLLFILYGLVENSAMVVIYWLMGSLAFNPGQIASIVGLCNAFGSLGSTAAFIIGAVNVDMKYQAWANMITLLVGTPGFLWVGWFSVKSDADISLSTYGETAYLGDMENSDHAGETEDKNTPGVLEETIGFSNASTN
ncbi:major facilitator superfamily domain-containing protein, partial [Talaromyces proteolyticus]